MLQPLGNKVVVSRIAEKTQTAWGLYIPDSAQTKTTSEGTVLAAGPGTYLPNGVFRAISVYPEQVVLFPRAAGIETTIDGERVVILREDEILF